MALFNRDKKKKDVLPQEVREYYQAERRDRTGMAWLLAIATLIVTFLIAAGLFFGGRWLYRTIFDNDDKSGNTTTSQTEKTGTEESGQANQDGNQNDQQDSNNTPETATPNRPTENGGQTSSTNTSTPGSSSSTGSVSGTATTGTTGNTSTPTATPNTGANELVNTGTGDIIGLFAIVVIASTLAHHVVVTNRR